MAEDNLEIKDVFKKSSVWTLFINQLNKDLANWSIEIPFDEANYPKLINLIKPIVKNLLLHDFKALVLLLYRIDIPEKSLDFGLEQNELIEQISDKIIQREFQKVVTKILYKKD